MYLVQMSALILVLAAVFYIWAILPNTDRRKRANEFANVKYAHRGLHNGEFPENSIGAFGNAIDNGFGIEIDVRLTKDNELVVFHDDNLFRMCGIEKSVTDCTYEELLGYRLNGTEYKIPHLKDVLKFVDGRTELLIEIKEKDKEIAVSKAAIELLKNYNGKFAVQSFSPYSINYFARESGDFIRGILVGKGKGFKGFLKENLIFNCYSKPDFISLNKDLSNLSIYINYKICNIPAFCWTVKNSEEEKKSESIFKTIIFENFIPDPTRKDYNRKTKTNALRKNKGAL